MELHRYPLDWQALSITLRCGHAINEHRFVRLVQNQNKKYISRVNVNNFILSSEYHLYPTLRFSEQQTDAMDSASNDVYSELRIDARVDRRPFHVLTHSGRPATLSPASQLLCPAWIVQRP